MNKKIRWIAETALMLALLIALQGLTKPLGQMVTGSFVNAVLAVAVLVAGLSNALVVALISPVLAYLVGIAPQVLTVPAIMVGNCIYVTILHFVSDRRGKNLFRQIAAWLTAAAAKFASLYAIVIWLICGVLSQPLLSSGTLKEPMIKTLTATFSWPQLFTALIGGAVALLIAPVIRKALKK